MLIVDCSVVEWFCKVPKLSSPNKIWGKVLISGAFQSDLRDPKCWHNSYIILRIIFMKKKFKIFSFFKIFFLHFWAKNSLLLYTWWATCPFDPQKCFLEAYSTKCPWNAPPVITLTSWSQYQVELSIKHLFILR